VIELVRHPYDDSSSKPITVNSKPETAPSAGQCQLGKGKEAKEVARASFTGVTPKCPRRLNTSAKPRFIRPPPSPVARCKRRCYVVCGYATRNLPLCRQDSPMSTNTHTQTPTRPGTRFICSIMTVIYIVSILSLVSHRYQFLPCILMCSYPFTHMPIFVDVFTSARLRLGYQQVLWLQLQSTLHSSITLTYAEMHRDGNADLVFEHLPAHIIYSGKLVG
jgi:hypothetical protein